MHSHLLFFLLFLQQQSVRAAALRTLTAIIHLERDPRCVLQSTMYIPVPPCHITDIPYHIFHTTYSIPCTPYMYLYQSLYVPCILYVTVMLMSVSRLGSIIEATGAATYHGFLPTLVRDCVVAITKAGLHTHTAHRITSTSSVLCD